MFPLFIITTWPKDTALTARLQADFATVYGQPALEYNDRRGLKQPGRGGWWTHAYLMYALRRIGQCDVIIKLDSDCRLHRKIVLPPTGDIFCRVWSNGICGGALAFTVDTARRLTVSGVLLGAQYRKYQYMDRHGQPKALNDGVLTDVARRLKLSVVDWTDVYAVRHGQKVPTGDYSVTHPVLIGD
jgi:hypothetical protein